MKAIDIILGFLLVISIMKISVAGFLDITGKDTLCVSKLHLWMDGIWLLLLALFINIIFR